MKSAYRGEKSAARRYFLGQHRIMGQEDSARDFDTSESMKNVGILDVFPIFHTARLGKRSAEACSSHCAVLPFRPGHDPQGIGIAVSAELQIKAIVAG